MIEVDISLLEAKWEGGVEGGGRGAVSYIIAQAACDSDPSGPQSTKHNSTNNRVVTGLLSELLH